MLFLIVKSLFKPWNLNIEHVVLRYIRYYRRIEFSFRLQVLLTIATNNLIRDFSWRSSNSCCAAHFVFTK